MAIAAHATMQRSAATAAATSRRIPSMGRAVSCSIVSLTITVDPTPEWESIGGSPMFADGRRPPAGCV